MVLLTIFHCLKYILHWLFCSSVLLLLFSCSVISDCDPQDLQHARFLIIHHLLELAQTHVHPISDAIQTSHPLFPPFLFPFHLSQHQGLNQWVSSSHQVAKSLELQLQHQISPWIFRVDSLQEWLVWSPFCPGDSQESFPAPQFNSINFSVLSLLYGPALTSTHDPWENHSFH